MSVRAINRADENQRNLLYPARTSKRRRKF